MNPIKACKCGHMNIDHVDLYLLCFADESGSVCGCSGFEEKEKHEN